MKPPLVVLFALLAGALVGSAFGEDEPKANVAIVRFSNKTDLASYDAACKAATDTLSLALSELGRYRVQSEDSAGSGEDTLRAMAEEKHLDFIIYGKMSKSGARGIDCSLSVFDRAKGKTTLSQTRRAAGVLDIFDTTDELVVSVLESMTGAHIGFGSLTLANTGETGSYTVLVDGAAAGNDLAGMDKVLIGRRTVTITQKRMLGDREIAKTSIVVKEGETTELSFAVPYLMDDEKKKIEELKASIEAEWNSAGASSDLDAKTVEFLALFGNISYSPKLATYKAEAMQLAGEWALRKNRLAIEGSAWEPQAELLDAVGAIYSGAKTYPEPEKIKKAFSDNAQFLATLFELKAGRALADRDLASGLECFESALILSTRYLGGERLRDYAYAVTTLQDLQEKTGTQTAGAGDDKDLKTVFGALMRAGTRFFDLKNQVEAGTACVLVTSDFSKAVSVDGSDYAQAPLSLPPMTEPRTISVQPKGQGKPIELTASAGGKILFASDGSAPYGKVVIGYIPGSIQVDVAEDGATVSLDDDDAVDAPHLFENLAPGDHKISIGDVRVGDVFYAGVEQNVTVESGKRFKFRPALEIGKAKLRVEDIPEGSTLLIDGQEQTLVANPTGGMLFDATVDAGFLTVVVQHGNQSWETFPILRPNASDTRSIKSIAMHFTIQRGTIKLKGKEEDWKGIDPIFSASGFTRTPNISGSKIAGGTICRDNRNLYIKMDFADGKPYLASWSIRQLQLRQDAYHFVNLEVSVGSDGTAHTDIWVEKEKHSYICGSYAVGPTFLEMEFPLSWFSSYFDFSKPIQANLQSFVAPDFWPTANFTKPVGILIGK